MARTVWITSDRIGAGELGSVLMRTFLYTLARAERPPARVLLANTGVRLACEGSDTLDSLRLLAEAGVPVRACGTCLDYLGLTASLAVGEIGDMAGAVAALTGDDDVLTVA